MQKALLPMVLLAACGAEARVEIEATSLLGEPLLRPELAADVLSTRTEQLAQAEATLRTKPYDIDARIWVGRRMAYLGRYRDAIEVFSSGIAKFPNEPRFYRHRGHRYITLRMLDFAIEDLAKAAALVAGKTDVVEPDGMPNARNIPTSTLHSNIYYHLGLARYLSGDFEAAVGPYRQCLAVSRNPDMLCATSHWLYMTLRRLGRAAEAQQVLAPIRADMDVIENVGYHTLLLLYRGERNSAELWDEAAEEGGSPSSAAVAYGVANWHHYNGRRKRARRLFEQIVGGDQWAAFGYIAAEAELAR